MKAMTLVRMKNRTPETNTAPSAVAQGTDSGILTGRDLAGFIDGTRERDEAMYSLLETEAVAMALDAGATYKKRVILVPRSEAPVRAHQLPAVLSATAVVRELPRPQVETTMFPNEEVRASILRSAQEVVSPSYPASEELLRIVSGYTHLARAAREEELAVVRSALFERSRSVSSSAD